MDLDKLHVKYIIKCELLKNARLIHQMGGYGMVGQVINVPVIVNNMVMTPPRQLDNYSFNVHLKRNLINKSTYLQGCIKKATVNRWLEHLIQTPLYKRYNTERDPTFLNVKNVPEDTYELDEINQHSSDTECLLAQQPTLLWSEDKCLEIAPGQNKKLLSNIYDEHSKSEGSLSWISACNQLKLHCVYQNSSNRKSIVDCVT
jgi:hypothetical protein